MRRWMTVMILSCGGALSVILLLRDRGQDFEGLARGGAIQTDAPIQASVDVVIGASPEKVWTVLTAVNDWPKWQPKISHAQMAGPVERGTPFTWGGTGVQIKSRFALVEPNTRLAWIGSSMNAHAIHQWKLERVAGGRTHVHVDESMSGFPIMLFYSSKDLEESDQFWLDRLKQEAER
jgi:hypothetical protein